MALAALALMVSGCSSPFGSFFVDDILDFDASSIHSQSVTIGLVGVPGSLTPRSSGKYDVRDIAKEAQRFGYAFVDGADPNIDCEGKSARYAKHDMLRGAYRQFIASYDGDCNLVQISAAQRFDGP